MLPPTYGIQAGISLKSAYWTSFLSATDSTTQGGGKYGGGIGGAVNGSILH